MTPDEIIESFERAYTLVSSLMRGIGRERGHPYKGLLLRPRIRVRQSEHLLTLFRQAELDYVSHNRTQRPKIAPELTAWFMRRDDLQEQIRLYGEAFYYFAWRAKNAVGAIPELNLKFDPVGVRTVRNRMIEHPDKAGGVHILTWQFDCPEGLMLEPVDLGKPGLDNGLYPNAEEFITKLLKKLDGLPRAHFRAQ